MKRYEDVYSIFGTFQEPWQRHCQNVARLSQLIAKTIDGCDEQFAYVYGLVHDIGRSTARSKKDPRFHCVDGFLILDSLGYDELKMAPLTHSFPCLNNLSMVPGYYNPLWDPDASIMDKQRYAEKGIHEWDTFIPKHLQGYEATTYDIIILLADLMSAGDQTVSIDERLDGVKEKYGSKPKDTQTREAIRQQQDYIEKLAGRKLSEIIFV